MNVSATNSQYSIDFDSHLDGVHGTDFAGQGLFSSTTTGGLDSRAWRISGMSDGDTNYGGTYNFGDHARGQNNSSNVTQGGLYAYYGNGLDGRAMGVQPTELDMTPGRIELRCINNTGEIIHTVHLDYDLYFRNWSANPSHDRINSFNASLRTENMGAYTDLNSGKVGPASLQYNSPGMISSTDLVNVPKSYSFSGVAILPGEYFYIQWDTDDISGNGERDEFVLDNIAINVQGSDSLVFYSQNSGVQSSTTGSASTVLWSTLPNGNVSYKMFPFQDSSSLVIQSSHIVEYIGSGSGATFKDLIVEEGAQLMAENEGIPGFLRYLYLFGDITCNGEIGNGPGTNTGTAIAFDLEPGSHTIQGDGIFNCAGIRKSNFNGLTGVCNLTFDMDVNIYPNGTGLYNDRPDSDGGTNLFNITISPDAVVNVMGDMGIDGPDPVNGTHNAGGSLLVEGTLNVSGAYYLTTNNNNVYLPVSVTVASGGKLDVGYFVSNVSGDAGHTLIAEPNSVIEISDRSPGGDTWLNNNYTNNVFDLRPNSTIHYSMDNSQPILQGLSYENLIVSGDWYKIVSPANGDLIVHGDLTIAGSAILEPNGQDIVVSGDWNNYNEFGFTDLGADVLFDNATGSATIGCGGIERFDRVIFGAECGLETTDARTYTNGWQQGDGNNGYFGNWILTTSSNDPNTINHRTNDSSTNGDGDSNGDGDIGNRVIALHANNGDTASGVLPFTRAMKSGSSFSIQMDNGAVDIGGSVGFAIQNANDEDLWVFYYSGGATHYTVNDANGPIPTTIPFTDEGLTIDIEMTGPTTFDVTVTALDGTAIWTGSNAIISPSGGQIPAQLSVFNINAGSGLSNACYFNNIQLCHVPATIDMDTDLESYGTMELYCRVNLNGNDVHFWNPPIVLGPNEHSFFVSEDILHQGTVSATVTDNTLPVTFPFGTEDDIPIYTEFQLDSGYAGVVTMATYRTAADNLPWPVSPTAVNNLNSTTGLTPDNRDATADRFWSITSTDDSFEANLTLSITDSELPGIPYDNPLNLVGQRYDEEELGGSWRPPAPGQSSAVGTYSPNTISVFIPKVTELSPWAVASQLSPLPVELLHFEGVKVDDGIELTWTTASEVSNAGFELRRFNDDRIEEPIAFVPGSGNSSAENHYLHLDSEPLYGWNYYRLVQHDFDGTQNDKGIVSVWWDGNSSNDGYVLNWTEDGLHISHNTNKSVGSVMLHDVNGRLLYSEIIDRTECIIDLSRSQSMYIIQMENGTDHYTQRIVDIRL
ncbi:MAG: T9SS type A sorting domain-containing protein [Flavobacteriales bacterium]|nr:T9SS type A sorting domain-containing protein [Flavobacteriales bacterium]